MFAQSFSPATGDSSLSVMQNEQQVFLCRAVSDLSKEIERHKLSINEEVEEMKMSRIEEEEEEVVIEQAECRCCGLKEECTKPYILEVQTFFSGKWVCGLCSEAVKERALKFPDISIGQAVEFHREFCDAFNATTRLNPKLSLTTSMRRIARKSFEKRTHDSTDFGSSSNRLSRSVSCDPKIEFVFE
ncbi:uncharacterized protein LOC111443561 [Cucurbita moschata]|uniref:Uncharacterized protein LOC111443561 n=1 Tax=Cucurbita moschata TaxID=3662 RepID=A0A6J1FAH1_CUCMO|nr:uncharacterized protein LOC111443561 [Cucurbita moschata]